LIRVCLADVQNNTIIEDADCGGSVMTDSIRSVLSNQTRHSVIEEVLLWHFPMSVVDGLTIGGLLAEQASKQRSIPAAIGCILVNVNAVRPTPA
jgi:hypothetical protein